ncbi:MAG: prolipoprotein diacylglyceryl transferase [Thermodesulfobacteriota bacterium]
MHPLLFKLGPLEIRYYSLMYILAILVCFFLTRKEVKRKAISLTEDDIINFIMWVVLSGVLGARAYYVLFNWGYYGANPSEIPAVWHGGLAIHGGLIGGFTAAYLYLKRLNIPFWRMADIVAPAIILGQAFGRFGNFMNGDAHGTPTDMPWGIVFPETSIAGATTIQYYGRNLPLHPTMLYEMVINLSIFLVLWFGIRKKRFKDGYIVALYLILYSTGRFFVESFRADSLVFGPLKAAQAASILLIVIASSAIIKGRLWSGDNI